MTNHILKWQFEEPKLSIEMPVDTKVLHVEWYEGQVTLWVLTPVESREWRTRHFHLCGTGWLTDHQVNAYVGTAIDHEKGLVWHVFAYMKEKSDE